jgi:hypothetical protein
VLKICSAVNTLLQEVRVGLLSCGLRLLDASYSYKNDYSQKITAKGAVVHASVI